MESQAFIVRGQQLVAEYMNNLIQEGSDLNENFTHELTPDDVLIVWSTKVLQNNKALFITTLKDGRYYEVTYNGDKGETYLDIYNKKINLKYTDDYFN